MAVISIARRFNGPPTSGNGGYCTGLIARIIGADVAVRLHQPVPMEHELRVARAEGDKWEVRAGDVLIASATPARVNVDVPAPPTYAEAIESSKRYVGLKEHMFSTCFVCGPDRRPHDGLRVFPGAVSGRELLAAPWAPDESLVDSGRHLYREHIWAALDCPGYFASLSPAPGLLGELAVRIERVPDLDEPCVVTGWSIVKDGRKHRAGTALFGENGELCAVGVATWIELKQL